MLSNSNTQCSISEIRLDPHLAVDTSTGSQYGSRGALAWTPPASNEGSTPTWTEGTPSFTESSSSGDMGKRSSDSCATQSIRLCIVSYRFGD